MGTSALSESVRGRARARGRGRLRLDVMMGGLLFDAVVLVLGAVALAGLLVVLYWFNYGALLLAMRLALRMRVALGWENDRVVPN
jgi:hypothetical protein